MPDKPLSKFFPAVLIILTCLTFLSVPSTPATSDDKRKPDNPTASSLLRKEKAQSRGGPSVGPYGPLPEQVPVSGKYWALIIGIDDYKNVNRLATLNSARQDALAVSDVVLAHYGFRREHMTLLLDEKATRRNIVNNLQTFVDNTTEADSVFIYYAGHGDMDRTDGWWIPYIDANAPYNGQLLTNSTIVEYLRKMPAKHVYVVIDSCFSGSLFGTRSIPINEPSMFRDLYGKQSRWALTSGGKQPVDDGTKNGHSIFAYHFMSVLRDNPDRYMIPSSIYDQVSARMLSNSINQKPMSRPLPQAGDQGGEFIFQQSGSAISSPDLISTPQSTPSYVPKQSRYIRYAAMDFWYPGGWAQYFLGNLMYLVSPPGTNPPGVIFMADLGRIPGYLDDTFEMVIDRVIHGITMAKGQRNVSVGQFERVMRCRQLLNRNGANPPNEGGGACREGIETLSRSLEIKFRDGPIYITFFGAAPQGLFQLVYVLSGDPGYLDYLEGSDREGSDMRDVLNSIAFVTE